ncbi:MAG TPA: RagB/SusD family nutrient uptake outer membrane protein [Prolixibacteraceae bacterium]|nr:RagB/SusD family nutrient uptake outer membrane protein [Prolixibacteraceae bacterium]
MKTSKYIVAISLLLFSSSCTDNFLDLAPISNMNESNFFETEKDFSSAVNGAYRTLYNIYAAESAVARTEQMSDNCTMYQISGNASDHYQFKDYTLLPSNSWVEIYWTTYYSSLFVINKVIEKLPNSSFDANTKAKYEAEMRFLRAIYYFNMVRLWGDLPLLLKPVSVTESYDIARTPVDKVYAQIISDLVFAESNLPLLSKTERIGQASKGAAQGMLGKVYATRGDINNAITYLKKVIDSQEYSLLPSYSQLWDLKNENSKEALFEIQFIRGLDKPASRYWQMFNPFERINSGGGLNQVTDNLWNDFEAGDARRDLSIDVGFTHGGAWVAQKFTKKWNDLNSVISGQQRFSENNFIVLRYADILLLYAELTKDAVYLNMIRSRAGVPAWGTSGYPIDKYPTLDLAIEHERRVELALEFHRWFDLKRTNRAIPVLTAAKGKTIESWRLLLPVPQTVIDQNPGTIVQNDKY